MSKEILDKIISLLPLDIKWDKLFTDEMNFVYNAIKNKRKVLSISVSKDIFDKLENKDGISTTSISNNILYITILDKKLLTLSLKKEKDKYILKSTYTSSNEQEEVRVTFGNNIVVEYKKCTFSKFEYYTSFKIQIGVFDKDYNRREIDTNKYEDMLFGSFFGIPIEDARYYMDNFANHIDFLNRRRVKNNAILDIEHEEAFRPPFKLMNLDYHIWEDTNRLLIEVGETDIEEYKNTHRLDKLTKELEKAIGSDGKILLSPALHHNLWDYREEFTSDILYSEGYIIKKDDNGLFTMYTLRIENNTLVAIPKALTEEEAKVFYYQNKANENSLELQEFFNINRSRK